MGGFGSGQGLRFFKKRKKLFICELPSLDSFQLFRLYKSAITENFFTWNSIGIKILSGSIEVERMNDKPTLAIKHIKIATTPCHYGGVRYWFVCPYCRKNIRKLYLGKNQLACRCCFNLAYKSQNESLAYRLLRKRNKIRNKLVSSGCGQFFTKPKWMHEFTYWMLNDMQKEANDLSWIAMYLNSKNMKSLLEKI